MRWPKHVYVQKPLAYSVHEARTMTEAAREHKVVTQMGNQGHSGDGTRLVCEWIEAGAIGVVEQAILHQHVVAVALEVERFAVAAAIAHVNEAPFTVFEDPILAAEEHRAGHAVE